jgi:copper transport protein
VQAEPLIHWPEPIVELVGFFAQFLAVGSVGFRYAAVRDRLTAGDADERAVYDTACSRAAVLGLVGAVVSALLFAYNLPAGAQRAHTTVSGLLTHDLPTGLRAVLVVVGIIGLALAAARRYAGWPLAAAGVIVGPLTGILNLQLLRLVNPVHRLVAGLWIGTLFVLLVAGLTPVLRAERVRDRRGAMVADMVNGFSPLALVCGTILVLSGLVTAWRHLNPLSSLWTHPYGWTLLIKLAIVAVVFALGAWNWRRQRPTLGSEPAAESIRRSSKRELLAATLVLVVTSILVSIPSPRPPGQPGQPGQAAGPGPGQGPAQGPGQAPGTGAPAGP